MKLYIGLCLSLATLINCNTNKTNEISTKENKLNDDKFSVQKISISERTRGTQRLFNITPNKIESEINGTLTSQNLSPDRWKKISQETNEINLNKIQTYISTTTKRHSDAALASSISITKNGIEYKSSVFDSGNPPAELKSLYEEIQKLIETKKSR